MKRKRPSQGLFTWCRLAELNCPFILTMDAYYHYTKAASALISYQMLFIDQRYRKTHNRVEISFNGLHISGC